MRRGSGRRRDDEAGAWRRGRRRQRTAPSRVAGDSRPSGLPDHPTPLEIKTHVAEPVPFVMWGPGFAANGAAAYTERRPGPRASPWRRATS